MKKKKVLFVSEASYLSTGYATYSREVLKRLNDKEKYELAEFSIYGGHADPRRSTIPWKNYPNLPVNDKDRERYNSNGINQFGAWRFERVCLDFKPDVVLTIRDFWMDSFIRTSPFRRIFNWCFPANTPVNTGFGNSIPIQDVKIGDTVVSHKGVLRQVTNTSSHLHVGSMCSIQAEGMPEPVTCTSDHKILVIKKTKRVWNTDNKRYLSIIDSINIKNQQFIPASELEVGDYLMLPISNCGNGLDLTDEDLWIIGIFLADGCATEHGRVVFGLHKEEIETLNRIKCYFSSNEVVKKFGIKSPDGELIDTSDNGINWRINSVKLQELFFKFYDDNGDKKLLQNFENLSQKQILPLLQGYFEGDGCITRTNHNNLSIEMFSKSKILAKQIAELFWKINIPARLNYRKPRKNSKGGYSVRANGNICIDILSKEKVSDISKSAIRSKKTFNRVIIKDNYLLMPIYNIHKYEDELLVYDIEVDEDHSFVTNCAVHNCWMPTVDAEGQSEEWLNVFSSADGILTYSEWAGKELLDKAGLSINYLGHAPPSASPEFKPVLNRAALKQAAGIDPSHRIVGTVMRNQRRKLYPDLFAAFGEYLRRTGDKTTYLYCHTGYPDNGWDFPKFLIKEEITSRVYFTYSCPCGYVAPTKFSDVVQQCPNCKAFSFTTTNVNNGLSVDKLANVYQLFDLYVQYANSEGFGIPQVEAAACGVPIACVDYSAMKDVVKFLDAYPIKVKALYNELETGCDRAIPDNDSFIEILTHFFSLPEEMRNVKGYKTRQLFEKNYNWDVTASQWEKFIDGCEFTDWNIPPAIKHIPEKHSEFANNKEFVNFILPFGNTENNLIGTYDYLSMLRDINFGMTKSSPCAFFTSEQSAFGREGYRPLDHDTVVNSIKVKLNENNFWERVRVGNINLGNEEWLQ